MCITNPFPFTPTFPFVFNCVSLFLHCCLNPCGHFICTSNATPYFGLILIISPYYSTQASPYICLGLLSDAVWCRPSPAFIKHKQGPSVCQCEVTVLLVLTPALTSWTNRSSQQIRLHTVASRSHGGFSDCFTALRIAYEH